MSLGPVSNRPATRSQVESTQAAEQAKPADAAAGASAASGSSAAPGALDGFKQAASALFKPDGAGNVLREAAGKVMNVTSDLAARLSGWDSSLVTAQMKAGPAAPALPKTPLTPTQAVDFVKDPAARDKLLASAPQINKISMDPKVGNGPSLCGGAALANALVLTADTKEGAKANEKAVRDLVTWSNKTVELSPAQDKALKRLGEGKMAPEDVQHLQQVMYSIGRIMPQGGIPSPGGLSTMQMTAAMTMLNANGAFAGKDVSIHANRNPPTADLPNGIDHWTVSANGKHVNSQGPADASVVSDGTPPAVTNKQDQNWQNELKLTGSPAQVIAQFKNQDEAGTFREATIDPSAWKSPGEFSKMLKLMTDAPTKPLA